MKNLSHSNRHSQDNRNDGGPPPNRNLPVRLHEPCVDVQLGGSLERSHELIPMEEVHVRQDAGYGSKGETVNLRIVVSKFELKTLFQAYMSRLIP